MRRPAKYWDQKQISWYVETLIHAMNADHVINSTEMDFFYRALQLVEEPSEKKRLVKILEEETSELKRTLGLKLVEYGWIFNQLVMLLISDYSFTEEESKLLEDFAKVVGLKDDYFTQAMQWCDAGLTWKTKQLELVEGHQEVSNEYPPDISVPIFLMEQPQLLWYAKVLVTTIVVDGIVDKNEIDIFKRVIGFIKDKKEMAQLIVCLKKKIKPALYHPQDISDGILHRIFVEVITHFTMNQEYGEQEVTFVKQLAGVCGFSHDFVKAGMDLWREGRDWAALGERLILQLDE
ncbi:MAG: hypothetical protein QNL04_08590 [SAR324 cluster bacterium]|nr:hypothetical protein [SAR324 cluster bacterium]